MAIVAKMQAIEVVGSAGSRYIWASSDDEGAILAEDAPGLDSYYGRPPWLADAEYVLLTQDMQAQERIKLVAVSIKDDPHDPNREWASATPQGELTMTINNPRAWGFIEPGKTYRITIEEFRGPRNSGSPES